jgi:hypothetical protein
LQIYLSKPLLRTEYIAGKAAILFTFLSLVTWVPALLLLFVQVMRGQLRVPQGNLFPVPAITGRLADSGAARDVHDAGAVVALEEQPLRGDPVLRDPVLLAAIYGAMYAITGGSTSFAGSRSAPT